LSVFFAANVLGVLAINWLLRKAVIQPLNKIVKVANEVSKGNMSASFEQHTRDEIGSLATAFERMKTSITLAMEMLNKQRRK
jgi:HAMP domain-containing protein